MLSDHLLGSLNAAEAAHLRGHRPHDAPLPRGLLSFLRQRLVRPDGKLAVPAQLRECRTDTVPVSQPSRVLEPVAA
ncbi:MAG: hypothetical protein HYY50_00430 [Candidatus Kerfeldbacteria bacterium]|nr:hypothetical protein [Candidatus Kerfeldbacteria bacterium]